MFCDMKYGFGLFSQTHSADPRSQDHPAPLDEKDRLVANHVLNIHVEPVTTCSVNKHQLWPYLKLIEQFRDETVQR